MKGGKGGDRFGSETYLPPFFGFCVCFFSETEIWKMRIMFDHVHGFVFPVSLQSIILYTLVSQVKINVAVVTIVIVIVIIIILSKKV
jgi:hypothetical protein